MNDLTDLAQFLRARISELAEEAFWMHGEDCDTRQAAAIGGFPCDCPWPKIIEADCEAKRAIVERCLASAKEAVERNIPWQATDARHTLELLALPYADRDDLAEKWKL